MGTLVEILSHHPSDCGLALTNAIITKKIQFKYSQLSGYFKEHTGVLVKC